MMTAPSDRPANTTILLADDHTLLRQGLRVLLESQPDLRVIGEAGEGSEALRLAGELRPDVLIVDVMMPGLSGLEVVRQAHRRWPKMKIIVLSMYDAETYVVEALQAGAAAYVLKQASANDIVNAVRKARQGGFYLAPPLDARAIEAYMNHNRASRADPYEQLTPRERQVFALAAEGLTNPQIAEKLSLSPRTVEMHRANLMRKLGLKSQTELVKFALKKAP